MLSLAAIVAAVQLVMLPPPKLPDARIILASVTLTGAGKATGAPPPPANQFFAPTGSELMLAAATF